MQRPRALVPPPHLPLRQGPLQRGQRRLQRRPRHRRYVRGGRRRFQQLETDEPGLIQQF